jgi:hypothetical protein
MGSISGEKSIHNELGLSSSVAQSTDGVIDE